MDDKTSCNIEVSKMLRIIFDDSSDPVFELDHKGIYLYANKAFGEVFGKNFKDIINKNLWDINDKEAADYRYSRILEVINTGKIISGEVLIAREGKERFFITTMKPLKDKKGNIISVLCVSKEITESKKAEEKLKKSEANLKALLNNTNDLIWSMDNDYNILIMNDAFQKSYRKFTGHKAKIGENFFKVLGSAISADWKSIFLKILNDNSSIEKIVFYLNKEYFYFDVSLSPIKDEKNEIIGITSVARNITDKINKEKEYKKLSSIYEAIIENPDVLITVRDKNGDVVIWNKAAETVTGYKKEDVLGNCKVIDWMYPDESYREFTKIKREEYMEGKKTEPLPIKIHTNYGTDKYISMVALKLSDEKGEFDGYVNISFDITEKLKAEEELKKSEEKYRFMADNIADVIWRLDKNYIFTYISSSVKNMMGYEPEEIIGQPLFKFLTPESLKYVYEKKQLLGKNEDNISPATHQLEMYRKDGEIIWVEIVLNLLYDEKNELEGFLGITRNITERKVMEEKMRYYATIDEMTGTFNRRTGFAVLEKEIELTKRNKMPLTLCFIDVNDLKYVNDTFGHVEGDEMLIVSTNIIRESIRESDTIFRMGGDEFMIIFPECSKSDAELIWERILEKIKVYNDKKLKPYILSLSHGIEEYNQKNMTLEKLLLVLDDLMYKEKRYYKTNKKV